MTSKNQLTAECLYINFLMEPLPIFCVFLTFFNDHWLKLYFAGTLTGKVSDFCGLFYFPLFLCALIVVVHRYILRRTPMTYLPKSLLILSLLLSGTIFISVKIYSPATAQYLAFLKFLGIKGHVTRDYSDLIALSVLFLSYNSGKKYFGPTIAP